MKLDLIPLTEQPSEVQDATRARYEPMKGIVPEVEWDLHAPYVAAINELKKQHR